VNEIRFIRQLKVWIKHYILLAGIRYSLRDLLSDLKMAICVRNGKWRQRLLWHHLASASCEFYV